MGIHSSILGWEIPWTEEPGGLQSWGHRVYHNLTSKQQQQKTFITGIVLRVGLCKDPVLYLVRGPFSLVGFMMKSLTICSGVSHMLLHETAKAREVGGHTGDAHHSAFSCQGKQKKAWLQTSSYTL